MVESAFAQLIPTPSIPEFTLKYIDYSYDVPPTSKLMSTLENVGNRRSSWKKHDDTS